MNYVINVSLNGSHFFATDTHSIQSATQLRHVYPTIAAKFPESEGYQLDITYWESIGYPVDPVTLER